MKYVYAQQLAGRDFISKKPELSFEPDNWQRIVAVRSTLTRLYDLPSVMITAPAYKLNISVNFTVKLAESELSFDHAACLQRCFIATTRLLNASKIDS